MFDPKKPVETRDGRKARILCTDRIFSEHPIVALITDGELEFIQRYCDNGMFYSTDKSVLDLVNVPVVRYEYQGVFEDKSLMSYRMLKREDVSPRNVYTRIKFIGVMRHTFIDGVWVSVEKCVEEA